MNKVLIEILEKFSNSNLTQLKYEDKEIKIELSKNQNGDYTSSEEKTNNINNKNKDETKTVENKKNKSSLCEKIKAPMVGIYYSKLNPEADVLVKIGDNIKKGQTLCIIEAMKMFNEITSPIDGIIETINFKDGDMVAFDDVLFEVGIR